MIQKGEGYEIPVESDKPAKGKDKATDPAETTTEPEVEELLPEVEAPAPEESWAERGGDEKTYEEAIDHLRRLQAEFVNYRKRVDRDRLQTVSWAQRALIEKLLPVLDDFDRAVASLEGDRSSETEGMTLIRDKLLAVLNEAGLERIETDGATFDPDIHEALMTQTVEPEQAGTVLAELVPGFLFKGRLVRPARVQVGVESEET